MSLYEQTLTDLIEKQTYVEVILDRFNSSSYAYCVAKTDDLLLLEKFDGSSRNEGILLVRRDDISQLRWNGNDVRNREQLIDQSSRLSALRDLDISSMQAALSSIHARFGHVSVYLDHLDKDQVFIGEIQDLDHDTLILHEFGTLATWDRRKLIVRIEDITRVESHGYYEKVMMRVYK